jgi:phosphatidylglycerophosphate synthase
LIAAINSTINSNIFDIFYEGKIIIILSTLSLIMDGLDGFIARKYNLVSKFGEIIDQESDNFLMLVISISLYLNKDIGLYVFLIPLYRYIFLASMKKYDWLKKTLPISQFRKIACVLTIILMIMSQDVYIDYENTVFLVILSLFIITFSFSKDIIWLYRNKNSKT